MNVLGGNPMLFQRRDDKVVRILSNGVRLGACCLVHQGQCKCQRVVFDRAIALIRRQEFDTVFQRYQQHLRDVVLGGGLGLDQVDDVLMNAVVIIHARSYQDRLVNVLDQAQDFATDHRIVADPKRARIQARTTQQRLQSRPVQCRQCFINEDDPFETLIALVGQRREGSIAKDLQPVGQPQFILDADTKIGKNEMLQSGFHHRLQ
ncbi:hypothetical protein D3C80_1552350 [compost metagenome]